MRPLLSLTVAVSLAGGLAGTAAAGSEVASREERYGMQMVRLALSTGRRAEGTVANGVEPLAITYARASALERALPRRRLTEAHATPDAVRRVLVAVASAVPRGVSIEVQARSLAQGARYVADVAAEHARSGHLTRQFWHAGGV